MTNTGLHKQQVRDISEQHSYDLNMYDVNAVNILHVIGLCEAIEGGSRGKYIVRAKIKQWVVSKSVL